MTAEEDNEVSVPLVTHSNNILSCFNPNGLYAHKSYISNNFNGAIFEYKGVLDCEVYDYEDLSNEIIEAFLSDPFFTRRMKMLERSVGVMFYGKLGWLFRHFRIAVSKQEK